MESRRLLTAMNLDGNQLNDTDHYYSAESNYQHAYQEIGNNSCCSLEAVAPNIYSHLSTLADAYSGGDHCHPNHAIARQFFSP